MREKEFLAYVLYITLLEIREQAYLDNNSRLFHLTDMLHNVPASLLSEESSKQEYHNLLDAVQTLNIPDWLALRKREFKEQFGYEPEDR